MDVKLGKGVVIDYAGRGTATITRLDGSEFELIISNEMDRDHLFIDAMLALWNQEQRDK